MLKARENAGDQMQVVMILVLHLIGWESGASFLTNDRAK